LKSSVFFRFFTIFLISFLLFGCSKIETPITPGQNLNPGEKIEFDEQGALGLITGNREVISILVVTIDPVNQTVTLEPTDRIEQVHFELTALYPAALQIAGIGTDPSHNNDFYADIKLTHPFPGSGIDGFDPRVIAVLSAADPANIMYFPSYQVLVNNRIVKEPDGYTKLFDRYNLPGNTNPFKAYFKDQPYRRWSSGGPVAETQRWYLDLAGFSGSYQFYLICDVCSGFPNPPYPVTDNAPEPVNISVQLTGDMASNGGYSDVEVTILDWQGSNYVTVGLECPELFDSIVQLNLIGPGVDPHTYIYRGEIGNYKLAPEGEYNCLVHAFDGFAAAGIYKTIKVRILERIDPVFDDVYLDFTMPDVKKIHVIGNGFGNEQGGSVVYVDGETTGFTISSWKYDDITIQIPNDNLDHTVRFELDDVLFDEIPVPESESILLIYNLNNADSIAIKDYYSSPATGRNIKNDMILGLNITTGEVMNRDQYNQEIKNATEQFILDHDLKYRIKYLVLCKGIPLKISSTHGSSYLDLDYAALDTEMALLFDNDYNLDGRRNNPYYAKAAGTYFHPFKFKTGGDIMAYLVTRLAAWETSEVYAMIDRGLNPYSGPDAYALLDGGTSYDRMESAATIYQGLGFDYMFENGSIFLTADTIADPAISDHVIAYTGHGIHHSPSPPGGGMYVYELGFTLLNGAIFNTYESFNCTTFDEAGRSGHGMVGDWIRIGGTGGIGHVYEPWSDAVGDERFLYPRQYQKHNLAESCYMACKYLSWTETIVGDPLCIIDVQQ
jgi:uncharacterized protein (TIGR03790 family)